MSVKYRRTVTCSVCECEEWADLTGPPDVFGSPSSPSGWAVRGQDNHGYFDVSLCSPACKETFTQREIERMTKSVAERIGTMFVFDLSA